MSVPTADQKSAEIGQKLFDNLLNGLNAKIRAEQVNTCVCEEIPFNVNTWNPFGHSILKDLQRYYQRSGYNVEYSKAVYANGRYSSDIPQKLCVSWKL